MKYISECIIKCYTNSMQLDLIKYSIDTNCMQLFKRNKGQPI